MSRFWKWLTKPFARNISPTLCRSGPIADADLKFPDKFARLVAQVMESEWPSENPAPLLPARCCGTCTARSSDGTCLQKFTIPHDWKRPDGVTIDRAVMKDDDGQTCGFWSDDPIRGIPTPKETATEALRGWGYGFVASDQFDAWYPCYGGEDKDKAIAECLRELGHIACPLYVQEWEGSACGDRTPVGKREFLYQGPTDKSRREPIPSEECSSCGGSGLPTASTRLSRCPYCRGTGRITAPPKPDTRGSRGTDAMTALGRMTNEQCESAD